MRTVTFYSYKGGTGRSLLLANLATLVARLGRRVVTLDLDLEAPGLHYKLLPGRPTPTAGAVDWLTARRAGRTTPNLTDLALDVPVPDPLLADGSLTLLPAGRAPSGDYFQLVQDLRLDEWLLTDGVDAFIDLAAAIRNELSPDYLFIDSRTGVTASNAVTTRVLADAVVVLTLDSLEQMEGTRAVLRTLQPLTSLQTRKAINLHVVHGRSVDDDDRAVTRIRSYLGEPGWPAGNTVTIPAEHCHTVRHDQAVAKKEFLPMARIDPHPGPLHADYLAVASSLLPDLMSIEHLARIVSALGPEIMNPAVRFLGLDSAIANSQASGGRPTYGDTLHERIRRLESLPRTVQNLTDLAMALDAQARGFSDLGQSANARDSCHQEVSIWRQLNESAPSEEARSRLASALHGLSAYLAKTGENQAALAAIHEATRLNRALAETNPAAFNPDLARSLNDLSNYLAGVGDRQAALTAIQESATLHRGLAETNPAFNPDLARSLYNLAKCLWDIGDRVGALNAARESVTLRRALAETDPAAFNPDLVPSLHNLSGYLAANGNQREALTTIQEAVTLSRALAETDPAAFNPGLAASLNSLSLQLADIGDQQSALSTIQEAVALYRALAETNPAAFNPDLARSLGDLSDCLADVGNRRAALTAIQDAVTLRRMLAEANPAAFIPNLATALSNLSLRLTDVGDHHAALTAIREAVALYRALRETNPAAFTPDLASSLNNLSLRLADVDERQAALAAIQETIELYQELADTYPAAFNDDLTRSRRNLENLLRYEPE